MHKNLCNGFGPGRGEVRGPDQGRGALYRAPVQAATVSDHRQHRGRIAADTGPIRRMVARVKARTVRRCAPGMAEASRGAPSRASRTAPRA